MLAGTWSSVGKRVIRVKIIAAILFAVTIVMIVALSAYAKKTASTGDQPHASLTLDLTPGENGTVTRVIDGDSLVLDSGLRVVLAGIQAPKLARHDKKNSKTYKAWPLAEEARDTLQALAQGKHVRLYYGGNKRDRYDRAIAQVFVLDNEGKPGTWLQQAMLGTGMARVYTWTGYAQDISALYGVERTARNNKQGIWNTVVTDGYYDIRKPDPDPLAQYVDSVQIVEGIVVKTADVRGTIYLNFGADYRTDFTIAISKKSRRAFKRADYDPLTLTGAHVRVRGYLELYGGPIIWLNDPDRLEVLD